MHRLDAALLAIFLGLLAPFHASAMEMELTTIPSSLGQNDRQLWRKVMTTFYGKYDKKQKCWVSNAAGKTWCMRPHTLHRVSDGSSTLYFIAAGGKQLDGANSDCHACTGALGLLVLSDAKSMLGIVARGEKFMDYGSWGQVPPEEAFSVHRLGALGNFAWAIENAWTGQGVTVSATDLWGIVGGRVKNLGSLPLGFSDSGNCDNGVNIMTRQKCSEVNFETFYEAGNTSNTFASIRLQGSGTLQGEAFTQSYMVDFDDATLTYPTPPDLPDALKP